MNMQDKAVLDRDREADWTRLQIHLESWPSSLIDVRLVILRNTIVEHTVGHQCMRVLSDDC